MSEKAYNTKMYHLSRAVCLPDILDMPKTMYELQPTYNLPSDVGESYYRSPVCQTSSIPTSCSNGKVACNTDEFSNSIHNLETNQKIVLEKLQQFKGRLESLLGNSFKSFDLKNLSNNGESAYVTNGNEIVDVIDSLKDHLLSKHLEKENQASFWKKSGCIHDIVISANPLNPPYSVIILKNILVKSGLPVLLTSKIHSSLDQLLIDPKVSRLFQEENNNERGTYDVAFTVLWKKQEMKSLMVSPILHSEIYGEANILRYISRNLPSTSTLKYERRENLAVISQTDYWLDSIQSKFLQGSNKERLSFVKQLNARLGTSQWIVSNVFGLADVFAWSVILQLNIKENLPTNAAKWFTATSKYCGLFSD